MAGTIEEISSNRMHGGWQKTIKHRSSSCNSDMVFGLYLPPQSEHERVPLLWFLSGLTCTHENAVTKADFQKYAAAHGIAVIYPDTSPRGDDVPNDEAYDMGQGAGFYVNATQGEWREHFQMYDYIVEELPALIADNFSGQIDMARQSISGHSMGGHGALMIALRNQGRFTSVSAFAPMANTSASEEWGRKQYRAYLGDDEAAWHQYDVSLLLAEHGFKDDILVDQGDADQFLEHLRPEALADAVFRRRQPATLRMQSGYDHSYFFITSFAEDHFAWHAERLRR